MSNAAPQLVTLSPEAADLMRVLKLGANVAAGALIGSKDFAKLKTNPTTVELEFAGIKVRELPYLQPGQIVWTDANGRVLVPTKQRG